MTTDPADFNDRVVAVANNKGGVYKTSFVANAAGQLAAAGYRILLVALDTQKENASTDLGYLERSDHGESLATAMVEGHSNVALITEVRPGLDVAPDGPALERVQAEVYARVGRGEASYEEAAFTLLHPLLADLAPNYDMVFLDCPPGNKVLVDAALGVARWLVIPTGPDQGSIKSMEGTADVFVLAKKHNPTLELVGVLLTGAGTQAHVTRRKAQDSINKIFGGEAPLFNAFIRHAQAPAVKSREEGRLIHELEKFEVEDRAKNPWWRTLRSSAKEKAAPRRAWTTNSSGLAEDYQRATQELVQRITEGEKS